MFRFLACIFLANLAIPALADEVFPTYKDYESFVDTKMKNREFSNVIKRLGGADEYTTEQLQVLQEQLHNLVPFYLTNGDLVKRIELENGFVQEMRIYWNNKNSYVFIYTFLHQRDDGLIVVSFSLNTSADPILAKF